MNDSSGTLPDVAISVGAVAVARHAHEFGFDPTPAQCETIARAVLEAGSPYLREAGPDSEGWPPMPDPES
ncbi:hypothetical protein RB614_34740 [Phytohabitans sp. ZYX-F-186]|uniref:Uncharacterized protein n=1 Tax=Phytohabitans maris TaxID=3071409 RepID=A0ABU0ZT90_9ACTN|nr:hypothetical protein [Phytohabitans sp. ZYX-F-186]MDQ7909692.1 hypothetical protein [Phytohabitans sp. ZYX-F-186]